MKALWSTGIVAVLCVQSALSQNCDVNRDGVVECSDLEALLACFGGPAVGGCATSDLNGNGFVDFSDLGYWLGTCARPEMGNCQQPAVIDLVAVSVDASALDQQPTCEQLQASKQYLPISGDVLVAVRNDGNRPSGSFEIAVFEDDNRDGQFQGSPLEEGYLITVSSLAIGETRTISVPFGYQFNQPITGQPPREFFGNRITMVVNPSNAIAESNLGNNRATSGATIVAPDITVSRIVPHYIRLDEHLPPTSVTFEARVGNAGNTATTGPVVVRWYDGNPAQGAPQVAVAQSGPLAPGEGAIVQFSDTGNPPFVFHHSMWVVADAAAGEADTQNNRHNWSCLGDINFDNQISINDLALLLSNFGASGAFYTDGDLTFDTLVDLSDLANMLGMFGQYCPSDCL